MPVLLMDIMATGAGPPRRAATILKIQERHAGLGFPTSRRPRPWKLLTLSDEPGARPGHE